MSEAMVGGEVERVTFFLFAYKQESYVRAACEAALAQTHEHLDIIFSDDCSPDGTFAIMQEVAASYHGPHRVRLNCNESNLGLIRHVNRAMKLVETNLVVVAAGDDISLPERTSEIYRSYREHKGKAFSYHSAVITMDEQGTDMGILKPPVTGNRPSLNDLALSHEVVIGATHAWTADVFKVFGDIQFIHAYEDLVIAFRSALLGGLYYIDKPLVRYRVGVGMSTTGESKEHWLQNRIKILRVCGDAFRQRRQDCMTVGKTELLGVLDKEIMKRTIRLMVYTQSCGVLKGLVLAFKNRCVSTYLSSYIRLLRQSY